MFIVKRTLAVLRLCMPKKLERLSSSLGSALRACGLQGRLVEYRIFVQWEKTVGPAIARHARPRVLRGKKLYLSVDSAAWMQQLSLMKPEIIEKLNSNVGTGVVKEIALNLGEIEYAAERPPDSARPRAPLSAEERERIDGIVQGIADSETRDALKHLIERDFQSKKGMKHG